MLLRRALMIGLSLLSLGSGGLWAQSSAKKAGSSSLPPPPVFATTILETLSAAQTGFARHQPRRVTLGSFRYERSLMTEVENRVGGRVSTLSLLLAGRYSTFYATIGRDDGETRNGPGAVVFEVWGDEKPLYQSQPMVSLRNRPQISGGLSGKVWRSPQELTIPIAGVRVLRLVTRYASETPQGGGLAYRARGCIWADARLTPGVVGRLEDPARDALRSAAIQLSLQLANLNRVGMEGRPLRFGVAPLISTSVSMSEAGQGGELTTSAEPSLRTALREFLAGARRGGESLFTPVTLREEDRLIPPATLRGEARDIALAAAAGKIGADVVITGEYDWAEGRPFALYALNVRDGKRIGSSRNDSREPQGVPAEKDESREPQK